MIIIYNVIIRLLAGLFRIASLFNSKANQFVTGRVGQLKRIKETMKSNRHKLVWIHCASLGEFEQGRPVIEAFKKQMPAVKILLTFFSPSGYELRKNYKEADWVFYLPWDTARNARTFVESTQPSLAIFVKYEYWHHYTSELYIRSIPIISVSSIFRSDQLFFKSYAGFYRNILTKFSHFFTQNYKSLDLLKSINITTASVAGDTRFDRVIEIVRQAEEVSVAKAFKGNDKLLVIGSAWEEDMEILAHFINERGNTLKFIIAPHEISESNLIETERMLRCRSIRFSKASESNVADYNVLIIDNIGMLARLYRYGEFAFVGGGFGKGLHNILEAACYGIPIFFGNRNYQKFQEAIDLINRGGAFEVSDYKEFLSKYEMVTIPENFMLACEVTRSYVEENVGATEKIMSYCRNLLAR
jgi:3-deoxy-D-manno-octulosonic-acid transferase